MKIEQLYTGCLAEAAYYIESDGEAVIIDPLRETAPYLQLAEKNKVKIKYVLETHFHADFVSGHLDLAQKTGAKIVYGPKAVTEFDAHIAQDGEILSLGKIKIKVIHTPGHTLESTCYLVINEKGKEQALFTGDTLFIGDVGRPDLAVKSDLTKEDLAGLLYESLTKKIMPLSNDIIIYPAHGAGSACGKKMSDEKTDTLGNQKKTNYALKAETKEKFIESVLDGILPPPQYFAKNAQMNKMGYEAIETVMDRGLKALSADEFEQTANETRALILDTRDALTFAKGYIPNAIHIGLKGQFAPWVGALILDLKQPILIVADKGKEAETVTRLARVGYDNTIGYLAGGFDAWQKSGKEVETIETISAQNFESRNIDASQILDVRKPNEFDDQHLEGVSLKTLGEINDWFTGLDKSKTYYVHCAGGYRSMIASSILKSRGFKHVVDIVGGYNAIKKTKLKQVVRDFKNTGDWRNSMPIKLYNNIKRLLKLT